ncbi:GNAT family N-acetyltransferase [Zooshikella harenae]|uniref:GNAT family N-acetyltransferase n=1 Tax=Zooshikella harenae TaxID=2827238 RepID=A0ABS5ZHK8_9GAMM|nr:GNAT family N-acetyltransferase [Zooshikella harenae]MBU2713554.1 GNAT family N-acetyltransferase [Zooshikella harenae]
MTHHFKAITINTHQLILRPLTEIDAKALFSIFSDQETMRYWSSPPIKKIQEADELIERCMVNYQTQQALCLGLEYQNTAQLIGTCTLFSIHQASRRAELGYILKRDYWGRGLMQEALNAFIHFAFTSLDLHRLEADIDPRNHASKRVLQRLGFNKEGFLRERWMVNGEISDTELYGLLHHEWLSQE